MDKGSRVPLLPGTIVFGNIFNAVVITGQEYETLKAKGVSHIWIKDGGIVDYEYTSDDKVENGDTS